MLAPASARAATRTRARQIYDDLKREVRAYDHMGHGPLDIALVGPRRQASARSVARLLGGFRTRLPTYASTYHGQDEPGGLDQPEAFADFALALQGARLRRLQDPRLARRRRQARGRERCWVCARRVGDDWPLMIDPACELRTWMDALHVGRACDEAGYFWYEDPYRDSGGLGRRPQAPAREAEDAASGQRACARAGAEGGVRAGRRLRHDPRRPRIRHGHHRGDEDRPFLRGAGPGRPVPRLRPGAPRGHGRACATPTSTRWR